MHGGGRNADDYLDAWVALAKENNLFVVAPEFENKFSNYATNDYQEGNLFTFFGTSNQKKNGHIQLWKIYLTVSNRLTVLQTSSMIFLGIPRVGNLFIEW